MLLVTPAFWPPLHYWSLHKWDPKYPLVCQKNEVDDAVKVQYRICVVDDCRGVPVLLVAYAVTEEEIERDWNKVRSILNRMGENVSSSNVCKAMASKSRPDGNCEINVESSLGLPSIEEVDNVLGRMESDFVEFDKYEEKMDEILSKRRKVKEFKGDKFGDSHKIIGENMDMEYPLDPDVFSAFCSCKNKWWLK